jgi:transcriptional regulator GlxA family with amidase domain
VRTLQQGFQRHLGMSPMAYLRLVRLRGAHRDLRTADPCHSSVALIAHGWGFTHLGRFAAAHKSMYGQTPQEALRSTS